MSAWLLLAAPGADGKWQRDLVPDGKALDLIVLADTSGSMKGDKIVGSHKGAGNRPLCMELLELHGIRLSPQIFFS